LPVFSPFFSPAFSKVCLLGYKNGYSHTIGNIHPTILLVTTFFVTMIDTDRQIAFDTGIETYSKIAQKGTN
jgi:hypothetical protein